MLYEQKEILKTIYSKVTFQPGSSDKRFINNLYSLALDEQSDDVFNLTEGQIKYLFGILYKYRKQVPQLYIKHASNVLCAPHKPKQTN